MKHPITAKPFYRKVVAALVESEERYRTLVEGVRRYNLSVRGLVLTIRDNGKGFRQNSASPGMGLQNMKYRASVIGGN
jgi:signal transduction histidine kinase